MRLRIMGLLTVAMFFFTGCYPTGDSLSQNDSNTITMDQINNIDERLSFSISFPDDSPSTISKMGCEPLLFENVDMESVFFGDNKGNYWKELHEKSTVLPAGDYYHLYAKGENESTLVYDAGMITYISSNAFTNNYILFPNYYSTQRSEEGMKSIFPDTEIKDFPSENAKNIVSSVITQLNIPTVDNPEIYAINQNAVDNIDMIEQWNGDNDAYLLVYPLQYNKIPTVCSSISLPSDTYLDTVSKLSVVVSKNGIEFFEGIGLMKANDEYDNSNVFAPENTISALSSYYSSMAIPKNVSKIEVQGCSLNYYIQYPTNDRSKTELVPIWVFSEKRIINDEGVNDMPFYSLICINALTGEVY